MWSSTPPGTTTSHCRVLWWFQLPPHGMGLLHLQWGWSLPGRMGHESRPASVVWSQTAVYLPQWSSHNNPDLAFVSEQAGNHTQTSRVILDPFPHSQHRPSLITTNLFLPCSSSLPLLEWNFRRANWEKFTDLAKALVDGIHEYFGKFSEFFTDAIGAI